MKKLLYTLVILATYTTQAQDFAWLKTPEASISLNPDMTGYCTATDVSGSLYFAGFKDTPTPYNDILGRLYLNKYTPDGTLSFEKIIEGKAQVYNILTDSNGNIIVVFGWLNTITIDTLNLNTVNQGMQYLLAKFDANGNLLWHHQMVIDAPSGTGLDEVQEFRALDIDNQGNIYAGYGNFMDGYITKYAPDGEELLTITQNNVSRISSLSIDNEGNILAAGSCINWTSTFAGTVVETELPYTDYVVKYYPTGQYNWIKIIESITCNEIHVVAKGPDEIYIAGPLFGAFAFDDIVTTGDTNINGDFYLARLNAEGAFQWVRQTPDGGSFILGYRNFLNIDNQGYIYLSGRASANIDWGNGVISGGEGLYRTAIVLKYNAEGAPVMAKTATSEYLTRFDGVSITLQGDMYVAGVAMGAGTFGSIAYTPESEEDYYPFSAKLTNSTTGVTNPDSESLVVYPNPASNVLYINGLTESLSGSIYAISGQKVNDFVTDGTTGIAVSHLPPGVYILKDNAGRVSKFIKH